MNLCCRVSIFSFLSHWIHLPAAHILIATQEKPPQLAPSGNRDGVRCSVRQSNSVVEFLGNHFQLIVFQMDFAKTWVFEPSLMQHSDIYPQNYR